MIFTTAFHLLFVQTWQVTVVVVIAWCLHYLFAKDRPHVAHMLWLIVLAKCMTPPVLGSEIGIFSWIETAIKRDALTLKEGTATHALPSANQPLDTLPKHVFLDVRSNSTADSSKSTVTSPNSTRAFRPLPIAQAPARPEIGRQLTTMVILVWFIGFVLVVSLAASRCWKFLRRLSTSIAEAPSALQEKVIATAKTMNIKRAVRILVTHDQIGPCVIGFFRPAIVLPSALVNAKPVERLEILITHELAHIRRGDILVSAAQMLVQSVWWFHPLVWLLKPRLIEASEQCCDEEVIARLGCSPSKYAHELIDILERKLYLRAAPEFPGVRPIDVTSKRLERIMRIGNGCRTRSPWWIWLALVVGCAITVPGAALVRSQDLTNSEGAEKPAPTVLPPRTENKPSVAASRANLPDTAHSTELTTMVYSLENLSILSNTTHAWQVDYENTSLKPVYPSLTRASRLNRLATLSAAKEKLQSWIHDGSWTESGDGAHITLIPQSGSLVVTQSLGNQQRIAEELLKLRTLDMLLMLHVFRIRSVSVDDMKSLPPILSEAMVQYPSRDLAILSAEEAKPLFESMATGPNRIEELGKLGMHLHDKVHFFSQTPDKTVHGASLLSFSETTIQNLSLSIRTAYSEQQLVCKDGNCFAVVSKTDPLDAKSHFNILLIKLTRIEEEKVFDKVSQNSNNESRLKEFNLTIPLNGSPRDIGQIFSFNVGLRR